jgi:hypothetical protein
LMMTTTRAGARTQARQLLRDRLCVGQVGASSSMRRGVIAQQQAHLFSGGAKRGMMTTARAGIRI